MRRSLKRCPRCAVHEDNCFCRSIESVQLKTKLSLILYKNEKYLPSNTANLSVLSLKNSHIFERGHQNMPMPQDFIDAQKYQPLYLYPSEESEELTPELIQSFSKPINLIVPDGTWRQAKKISRRETHLQNIPHVRIIPKEKSKYLLRRQKYEYGLCTHEAIAEALGIIECLEIKQLLLRNFDYFMQAHLKYRSINRSIKKKEV